MRSCVSGAGDGGACSSPWPRSICAATRVKVVVAAGTAATEDHAGELRAGVEWATRDPEDNVVARCTGAGESGAGKSASTPVLLPAGGHMKSRRCKPEFGPISSLFEPGFSPSSVPDENI